MTQSATDRPELRTGDRIVLQAVAGVVVDVAENAFWLDTGSGTRQYPGTAPWRVVADRDSCQRLLEQLCSDLDVEPESEVVPEALAAALSQVAPEAPFTDPSMEQLEAAYLALPLEPKVGLLRAVRYTPERVPTALRRLVWYHDRAVYGELACGLAVPRRVLRAAVDRGDSTLQGLPAPRDYVGHLYLGSFQVRERLLLCDPCYIDEDRSLLINRASATAGTWHAYARYAPNRIEDTVALMAVHEDHLDRAVERGSKLRSFTVDSGHAAIVCASVLKDPDMVARIKDGDHRREGMFAEYGCTVATRYGDGVFDSLVLRVAKRAVMVRLNLSGDPDHSHFHSVAATRARKDEKRRREQLAADVAAAEAAAVAEGAAIRPYSIAETFAEGEVIRHPVFGDGLVARVMGQKIEVQFHERPRVLIHGRQK